MKVLIGSNGGLTGIYLAKRLRRSGDIVLYGADSSEITTGKFFVDDQRIVPRADTPQFISELVRLLNTEGIDIYLPTNSIETRIVSKYEGLLREKTHTNFIVSPIETFCALENKATAASNLLRAGIPTPRLIEGYDTDYPIFMKRILGSGSNGSQVIENSTIHRAYAETTENIAFFQLIQGKEYTVDCLFNEKGELLGFNQRRRLKTIGGAVSITENDDSYPIAPWINKLCSTWVFKGCVNFQYILQDEIPYFIDINLRYPSGGLPLTVESGLDIPQMIYDMLSGKQFSVDCTKASKKAVHRMYRYFEETFE